MGRLILLCGLMLLHTSVLAQVRLLSDTISVDIVGADLEEVVKTLITDYNINISYSAEIIPKNRTVSIVRTSAVETILTEVFLGTGIGFKLIGQQIVLVREDARKGDEFIIKGYVRDSLTGEDLPGAMVRVAGTDVGAITNTYGFYSLTLPTGDYDMVCSYLGYQNNHRRINLINDAAWSISLANQAHQLEELIIEQQKEDKVIDQVRMGTEKLSATQLKQIPALMGETDVVRGVLSLPGVQSVGEGKTGLFVRGARAGQTLIQLDEANIFNAFHIGGLFSVFNPDAIRDVKLYKGAIPANYGGRAASVLDIRMKDGHHGKITGTGGWGTISSRLTIEGPLTNQKKQGAQDKGSFMISGRRTYLDLLLSLSGDESLEDNTLFFYDLNGKVNYNLNENNRLYLSAYTGKDVFSFEDQLGVRWGNFTTTARWNHIFNKSLFLNTTFLFSNFDYGFVLGGNLGGFDWNASLQNYSIKTDFYHYLNPRFELDYGYSLIWHHFSPATIKPVREGTPFEPILLSTENALEQAGYVSFKHDVSASFKVDLGLRVSLFQNFGPGEFFIYQPNAPRNNANIIDTLRADNFELVNTEFGLEPRLNMLYELNSKTTLRASYNRNKQYLHVFNGNNIGFPTDRFKPTDPNIRPQTSNQYSIGVSGKAKRGWEVSAELYYRNIDNLSEINNEPNAIISAHIEQLISVGKGWSYGLELSLRKVIGRTTGWLSYTWASTWEQVPELNGGKKFHPFYDRTHDFNLSVNYALSKRVSVSGNWLFNSGQALSLPIGKYQIDGKTVPRFDDLNLNGDRGPVYHRLDLSIEIKGKNKKNHRWQGSWNIALYNVYFRKNSLGFQYRDVINGDPTVSQTDPDLVIQTREFSAINVYLFRFVPSITYNFKF